MDSGIIQQITYSAIPIIFAITFHEAAHAYAARYFGDSTAYMMGRITLNPVKHIDPIWTIAVPLITMLTSGFMFGAAKPVPVNFDALRNPRRDSALVAAAGPLANLAMAIIWAVVLKMVLSLNDSQETLFLYEMARAGVAINISFMVLNLFPLLPLDGGRIVAGLLPPSLGYAYSRLEPYGMFILVFLLISRILGQLLGPLANFSQKAVYSLIGLS